ncbi:asparaginase [Orrella sp. JC864]|uniref:asparaginase n=1 Tax=Orrella sp. JC864 TaxID=3120298 RepID=UPI00300815B0
MPEQGCLAGKADQHRELPRIALLATGGTIAGAPAGNLAYKAGALPAQALLQAVPGLARLARIECEQVAAVGSQNMTLDVWRALAARAQALCDDDGIAALVVTHGTDTMEETAYLLSLVLRTDKPVVMTGAMRPAGALGADGPANLHAAVAVAAHPGARGRGVLVAVNDQVFAARDIQKSAANGLCAWSSPGRGPCAHVHGEQVAWQAPAGRRHTSASQFAPWSGQMARVGVLYAHADMDPAWVRAMLDTGVQGMVLAGVGDGNATDAVLHELARAVRQGVAVVRATRTGSGAVRRNVEVDDQALGFVAAGDLNPQKARILLALALTRDASPGFLQDCYAQY